MTLFETTASDLRASDFGSRIVIAHDGAAASGELRGLNVWQYHDTFKDLWHDPVISIQVVTTLGVLEMKRLPPDYLVQVERADRTIRHEDDLAPEGWRMAPTEEEPDRIERIPDRTDGSSDGPR